MKKNPQLVFVADHLRLCVSLKPANTMGNNTKTNKELTVGNTYFSVSIQLKAINSFENAHATNSGVNTYESENARFSILKKIES